MEAKKIEIKIFLLSLATLVLIETAATLLISGIKISSMVVTGVVRLIETVLVIIIVMVWGQGLPSIGLAPSKMVKGLIRGLFWSAGFGIIYGFFRRWGVLAALILSSVIFVLAHATLSGIPVPQIIGGIIFAIAYEREGSLIVPITIHVLGNMAIFTLSLIY